jgi:hypothetical protein
VPQAANLNCRILSAAADSGWRGTYIIVRPTQFLNYCGVAFGQFRDSSGSVGK